jgi:hypothetical protein
MPGRFLGMFFLRPGMFFTWIAVPRTQLWHDFFTIVVEPALTAFVEATFTNESNHPAQRSLKPCLSPVGNAH